MPKKKLTRIQIKKKVITIRKAMYDLFLDKFSYGTASYVPISLKKLEEMYGFMTGIFNKISLAKR